jgi:hypothetical protein
MPLLAARRPRPDADHAMKARLTNIGSAAVGESPGDYCTHRQAYADRLGPRIAGAFDTQRGHDQPRRGHHRGWSARDPVGEESAGQRRGPEIEKGRPAAPRDQAARLTDSSVNGLAGRINQKRGATPWPERRRRERGLGSTRLLVMDSRIDPPARRIAAHVRELARKSPAGAGPKES